VGRQRTRALAQAASRALEQLAVAAGEQGDLAGAVGWWRRLAEAEPLSTRAALGLMRALDASGERAAALQHARVHELMVAEELGGAPDPSVSALAAELRAGTAPPPAAGRMSRRRRRRSMRSRQAGRARPRTSFGREARPGPI
jgi:DNA-binding SARP family transcriptional activator